MCRSPATFQEVLHKSQIYEQVQKLICDPYISDPMARESSYHRAPKLPYHLIFSWMIRCDIPFSLTSVFFLPDLCHRIAPTQHLVVLPGRGLQRAGTPLDIELHHWLVIVLHHAPVEDARGLGYCGGEVLHTWQLREHGRVVWWTRLAGGRSGL